MVEKQKDALFRMLHHPWLSSLSLFMYSEMRFRLYNSIRKEHFKEYIGFSFLFVMELITFRIQSYIALP